MIRWWADNWHIDRLLSLPGVSVITTVRLALPWSLLVAVAPALGWTPWAP